MFINIYSQIVIHLEEFPWRSVVSKGLDCDIVVSEFEIQLRCYIHFWTNTLREKYELPSPHPQLWVK